MDAPADHWTPGPWAARWGFLDDEYGGRNEWCIESEQSGYLGSPGATQVCTVGGEDSGDELPSDWVAEADARLIALAPTMAAAVYAHATEHNAADGCELCRIASLLLEIRRPLLETDPELLGPRQRAPRALQ